VATTVQPLDHETVGIGYTFSRLLQFHMILALFGRGDHRGILFYSNILNSASSFYSNNNWGHYLHWFATWVLNNRVCFFPTAARVRALCMYRVHDDENKIYTSRISNFNIQCTEATAQCKPKGDIHPIARPTAGTSCGGTAARTTQATENAYWMHKGRQYSIYLSVE
jgi:hypothetical protein